MVMAAQPTQPAGEGMADADDGVCTAPKVLNPPDAIWLNYGDIDRDCTHEECADGVTWCAEEIDDSDVRYVRANLHESIIADRDRLAARCEGLDRVLPGLVEQMDILRDDFVAYSDGKENRPFVVVRDALIAALNEYDDARKFLSPPASDATEPLAAGVA